MGIAQAANLITDRDALKSFFGTTPNLIGDLPVDVIRRENNVNDFNITEHPTEDGASMTDARIKNAEIVRLECTITDDFSDVSIGSIVSAVKGGTQTWREKLVTLEEIRDSNELITVTTPFQTYENRTIKSIIIEQTPDTSQALVFTLELKELRIVTAQLEQVSEASIPKRKKAKKTEANKEIEDFRSKGQNKGKKNSIIGNLVGVGS
jgi:hypothetical protein